ncbi:MAG: DoxX family protein [Bacteroidota bacterium]|nr:DoxX family protein [Bacteroidota bacterium]
MSRISRFFLVTAYNKRVDIGLLILRVGTSLLMIPHGWSKMQRLHDNPVDFYNFLGMGPEFSLLLIILAEFFCSILLILGIGTRAILVPLIISMVVVVLMVHGSDPMSDKEHGLLFLVPYVVLFVTGPGKYSMDYIFFGKKMLESEAKARLYF